jgi:hypothetical protein
MNECCRSGLMSSISLFYYGKKNWNPARWMLLSNSSSIQTGKRKRNQSFVPRAAGHITEINSSIYIRINTHTNIKSTQTRIKHSIVYWLKLLILITSEIIKHLNTARFSPLYYNAMSAGMWIYQIKEEQPLGIFTYILNM